MTRAYRMAKVPVRSAQDGGMELERVLARKGDLSERSFSAARYSDRLCTAGEPSTQRRTDGTDQNGGSPRLNALPTRVAESQKVNSAAGGVVRA